ncbi:MAG: alpha/beta fold hydrolase [Eubacteriaceae bacterium]
MFRNKEYIFNGWNNKAVMLIHGATSGSSQLRPLANFLNCHGYTVYGVNLAGHGTTKEDLAKTKYEDIIDKAEKDFEKMKAKNYDKLFVAGISLGGLTAAYLAASHPELSGFATYAAGLMPIGEVPPGMGEATGTDYVYRTMEGKVGLYRQYHVHYEYIPIGFYKQIGAMGRNFMENNMSEKITAPALIVHTLDDTIVYPKSSEYLYEHIKSKDKELLMMDVGEHLFVLSEYRYEPFEKTLNLFNRS